MGKEQLKLNKDVLKNFEAETQGLYLTGVCRCGKHFNVYVEMPTLCHVTDESGNSFNLKPAEHVVLVCPRCNRLVNCGNGTRREDKKWLFQTR
jgi:hypothetical protein